MAAVKNPPWLHPAAAVLFLPFQIPADPLPAGVSPVKVLRTIPVEARATAVGIDRPRLSNKRGNTLLLDETAAAVLGVPAAA